MASTIDIIVFGNGALFEQLFNGIAICMGGPLYLTLLKCSGVATLLILAFQYIQSRQFLVFPRYFLVCFFLFHLMFLPKVNVTIDDEIERQLRVVSNVPLGIAMMAHVSTHIGAALTETMEEVFSLPDDLRYNHAGYILASSLMRNSTQFQSLDPTFQSNLKSYMRQCVFYDLYLKKYSLNALIHAEDLWDFLKSHRPSPARMFRYRAASVPSGEKENDSGEEKQDNSRQQSSELITCKEGIVKFETAWKKVISASETGYSNWAPSTGSKTTGTPKIETGTLVSSLGASYSYLLGVSQKADDIMKQVILANAFRDASAYGGLPGSGSPVARYAFSRADAQKQLMSVTMGMLAYKYLPVAKNCLACLLFAGFIFVFPMSLLPGKEKHLKDYFLLLLWIECWAPVYSILNFMMTAYAKSQLAGLSDPLSLSALGSVSATNSDIAALAGYMSLSVPMLSWYFVKFSEFTITQFAGQMGGLLQGAASGAVSEAISGNLSMGNTHFANHSAFNNSAFQVSRDASLQTGSISNETLFGQKITHTASGQDIFPLSVKTNVANAVSNSLMKGAEHFGSLAKSESNTISSSVSSLIGDTLNISEQQSQNTSKGEAFSTTESARHVQSLTDTYNLLKRSAENQNVSTQELKGYLVQAALSGNVGGNLLKSLTAGLSGRLSADRGHSQHDTRLYQAAQEFVHGLQENDVLDDSFSAVHSGQYHTQDAKSQQYAHNMNNAYNDLKNATSQRTKNLQKADSLREQAQYARTHSRNVSSDFTQPFINWLETQKNEKTGLSYTAQEISAMQFDDPKRLQALANQYVDSLGTDEISKRVRAQQQATEKKLNQGVGNLDKSAVERHRQGGEQQLKREAADRGIGPGRQIDTGYRDAAREAFKDINDEYRKKELLLTDNGQKLKQNVNAQINALDKKVHSWNPLSWFK